METPTYKIPDTVRSTHSPDGAIVLDIRQGQMFSLNFVGSRILELLRSESTAAPIVDRIVIEFGVGREQAESDFDEFVLALKKYRLLEQLPREWNHGIGATA